jgi:hypothetical protein
MASALLKMRSIMRGPAHDDAQTALRCVPIRATWREFLGPARRTDASGAHNGEGAAGYSVFGWRCVVCSGRPLDDVGLRSDPPQPDSGVAGRTCSAIPAASLWPLHDMTAPDRKAAGKDVQGFRCPAVRSTKRKDQSAQMPVVLLRGPVARDQPSHGMSNKNTLFARSSGFGHRCRSRGWIASSNFCTADSTRGESRSRPRPHWRQGQARAWFRRPNAPLAEPTHPPSTRKASRRSPESPSRSQRPSALINPTGWSRGCSLTLSRPGLASKPAMVANPTVQILRTRFPRHRELGSPNTGNHHDQVAPFHPVHPSPPVMLPASTQQSEDGTGAHTRERAMLSLIDR